MVLASFISRANIHSTGEGKAKMAKPQRKLFVASVAPGDYELLEEKRVSEGRTRGELLSLLIREAGLVREPESEEVSR